MSRPGELGPADRLRGEGPPKAVIGRPLHPRAIGRTWRSPAPPPARSQPVELGPSKRRGSWMAGLIALFLCAGTAWAEGASQDFAARFFRSGTAARPITAAVGVATQPLDATLFPCAGCHALDGQGRAEGGTRPADIRWRTLTSARNYDQAKFCRALTQGVDPQGRELAMAMPRYGLETAECDALWEYLRRLEQDLPPGVTAQEITIALELGAPHPLRQAWRDTFTAEIARLAGEGLYGRRIRVVTGPTPAAIEIELDMASPAEAGPAETQRISLGGPASPTASNLGAAPSFQIETPWQRQFAVLMAQAPDWLVLAGAEGEALRESLRDAALDAEATLVADLGQDPCQNASPDVLILRADQKTWQGVLRLDSCPGSRRYVWLDPHIELSPLQGLRHPNFLVVAFDPGPELDLFASAKRLAAALVLAFELAGREIRVPALVTAMSRAFAENGGTRQALYDGIFLWPLHQREAKGQWLTGGQ